MNATELLHACHAARYKAEGLKWAVDLLYRMAVEGIHYTNHQHLVKEEADRFTAEADRLWAEWEVAAANEPAEPTLPNGYSILCEGACYQAHDNVDEPEFCWGGPFRPTMLEAIADAHAHHLSQQHNGA